MKKLLTQLKKHVRKDFGKRCKDFYYGCPNCMVWMAIDILENSYLDKDWIKKHKKKK